MTRYRSCSLRNEQFLQSNRPQDSSVTHSRPRLGPYNVAVYSIAFNLFASEARFRLTLRRSSETRDRDAG
jgi:hypothetical protein